MLSLHQGGLSQAHLRCQSLPFASLIEARCKGTTFSTPHHTFLPVFYENNRFFDLCQNIVAFLLQKIACTHKMGSKKSERFRFSCFPEYLLKRSRELRGKLIKRKKAKNLVILSLYRFGRDYWTRTSDLAPPRRVRYQLR